MIISLCQVIDGNWNTSAYGIGKYLEGGGPANGALVRGGHFGGNSNGKSNTGIFAASLNRKKDEVYQQVGFRCSYTLPSE